MRKLLHTSWSCEACALATYFVALVIPGFVPEGVPVGILGYALFFLATALFEEGVFCGIMLRLFDRASLSGRGSDRARFVRAAFVTAALFGLAHLRFEPGSLGEGGMIAIGLGLAKVVQAAAFMMCMTALYARTGRLVVPVVAHFAFDLAYFAAPYGATGMLPPYPLALSLDAHPLFLVVTAGCFIGAAIALLKVGFSGTPRWRQREAG